MILVAAGFFTIFGLFSIAGGALGWRKAGSKASLIAGGLSGAFLLIAAGSLYSGQIGVGLSIGGVTSLLLAGRFVPSYMKTRKMMPQGMMALLAVVGIIVTAAAW